MSSHRFFKKVLPLILFSILGLLIGNYTLSSNGTTQIRIEIFPFCSNGTKETGEQCDGDDFDGATCQSLGYAGGTLTCNANCTFNTDQCTSPPPSGGGGGWVPPPIETKVIIKGKAYPSISVTVLQDGKIATVTKADSQANFEVEITKITPGVWTFGVWAEDKKGVKSLTFSFTTNVISGVITTISGIFLPPTIDLDETTLQRGEILNILGQTAPQSEVSIIVNSPEEIIKKTTAETDGTWFYGFDTTPLEEGSHTSRAQATSLEGLSSTFSQALAFSIGKEIAGIIKKADINGDEKVNLVDFSVLLYNWGIPKNPAVDLNSDDKVDLRDFSILLYYWTG